MSLRLENELENVMCDLKPPMKTQNALGTCGKCRSLLPPPKGANAQPSLQICELRMV
jgi:hypothetical protein